MKKKLKVFLGGTTTDDWRGRLIPMLQSDIVDYYNPIVSNWDDEAQQREIEYKETSDINLYVITPAMAGVFSIAEVVDDSNKRPDNTIFCILKDPVFPPLNKVFTKELLHSLSAVEKLVDRNGAIICHTLTEVANTINVFAENLNDQDD